MKEPNPLDVKTLHTKLENSKLILEVNSALLDGDESFKQQLTTILNAAQRHIDEASHWEELGDQTKYSYSMNNANVVISEISQLIIQLLKEESS